jgi:hypothetical protein
MMRRRTGVDIEVSEVEIISHAEQPIFDFSWEENAARR